MKPKVTLIIAVYNGEGYVDACVNSAKQQTYENLEILFIDDGSTDRTGKLLEQYAAGDARIRIIHQNNRGVSGARNAGIRAADGEYILFADIDDRMDPDMVADNVTLAELHRADVVIMGFLLHEVEAQRTEIRSVKTDYVGTAESFFREKLVESLQLEIFHAPWNKLIRRSFLMERHLTFDERFQVYEDAVFAAELLPQCKTIVMNHKVYYHYYFKKEGSLISAFTPSYFDSVTELYRKLMNYCAAYEDHRQQEKEAAFLYQKLTMVHIKQISCSQELTWSEKERLLERILRCDAFQNALSVSEIREPRKQVMRFMIRRRWKTLCILFYRVLNRLQRGWSYAQ